MKVIEIDDKEFNDKIKDGKVLVDCYASWCGPCKMLSPIIDELANEVEGYTFYKVNIDDADNVCSKYNIVSIPTILIFEDGELKNRIVGLKSKEELKSILN